MRSALGRRAISVALAILIVNVVTFPASAEVCGDADGSGSVTVTDGVQVLRSAAGLSSTCAARNEVCDVDGNGTVSLTDGVNVLRIAAELPVTANCRLGTSTDVQEVTGALLPFLTVGLGALARGSAGAGAAGTSDCPFGGTADNAKMGNDRRFTAHACVDGTDALGHFQFDGTIDFVGATGALTFDITMAALATGRTTQFTGTVQATISASGGFALSNSLTLTTAAKTATVHFANLVIDGTGHLGTGSAEVTDDGNFFAFASFALTATSAAQGDVEVDGDDGSTSRFLLDLDTGALTPAT